MFSLINIPRDHLFTIFSFCSTPSLGNLAKVCKDLKVKVGEYLKIRYSDEKIAFFKENHKIKKVILKKIELNSFPQMRSFKFKMPCKLPENIRPDFFFGEDHDFFIFKDGNIKLLDLKKGNKKNIKICVKTSVFFKSSIKKNLLLKNSVLLNKAKSHFLLKDTVLNIYAIFSIATKTIQFASYEEILFAEADVVILYNKRKVIIVKKNEIKLTLELNDLTHKVFKNGILIIGSQNGRLIGIDLKTNQILFVKEFNSIQQLKIIDNNKFVIETDALDTFICECKTGNIIFNLKLNLLKNVVFGSGKLIVSRMPPYEKNFYVVDLETGRYEMLQTEIPQKIHSISNNRLIVKQVFLEERSAISIYDLSSLKMIASHYFQTKYVSITPINEDYYAIASTHIFPNSSFFYRFNFCYGILELASGKYQEVHSEISSRNFHSKLEASNKYIAQCDNIFSRTEKIFRSTKHEVEFTIKVFSLMEDSLKNK